VRQLLLGLLFTASSIALAACGPTPDDPSLALLGGDTTIFDTGDESFGYPLANMAAEKRGPFQIGDGIFNRNWVTAPATPQGFDGLGPIYNAISCSGCHASDGRGAPPTLAGQPFLGLLLRLSIPGMAMNGGPLPDVNYGNQLQPYAILEVPAEGTPAVSYTEMPGTYADGTPYSLRMPTYSISELSFGPLDPSEMFSPRLAPQVIGLGLLEAVSEQTILGFAAENGGRQNRVWDDTAQQTVIGRFGWKANQPSLEQQMHAAFLNDIGITSTTYPAKNCPAIQYQCADAPQSMDQPNLQAIDDNAMVVHTLGLAVPARRSLGDAQALQGEALFSQIGCAKCHIPTMQTGSLDGWPELSQQTIHPFTDLLLHDMGAGLADLRPDFLATGYEWRTPPLWGLGLAASINGYLFLLHDGRARSFEEAILWHGGAAQAAAEGFQALSQDDRAALVAFLNSL
jgi:CxxC motif-containing protein (DUF1111 family)